MLYKPLLGHLRPEYNAEARLCTEHQLLQSCSGVSGRGQRCCFMSAAASRCMHRLQRLTKASFRQGVPSDALITGGQDRRLQQVLPSLYMLLIQTD